MLNPIAQIMAVSKIHDRKDVEPPIPNRPTEDAADGFQALLDAEMDRLTRQEEKTT